MCVWQMSSAQLRYYKSSSGSITTSPGHWEDMPSMAHLPERHQGFRFEYAFLMVVHGVLYAYAMYGSRHVLYRYCAQNNVWNQVCKRIPQRSHLEVAYLNSYFYFVEISNGSVTRFDTNSMSWEDVPSMPKTLTHFHKHIVTTFRGMLLVYGHVKDMDDDNDVYRSSAFSGLPSGSRLFHKPETQDIVYSLQVYDPKYDRWTQTINDSFPCELMMSKLPCYLSQPVLMTHKGMCYRIMFKLHYSPLQSELPIVHEVEFHKDNKGALSVELGEEVSQDKIPPNKFGAFQIDDDVFVSCGSGFVVKMEWSLSDKIGDNGRIWERLDKYSDYSNVVNFTFDQRLTHDSELYYR